MRRLALMLFVCAVGMTAFGTRVSADDSPVDPSMPFDHMVLIVEQDHTYDSYFRGYEPDPSDQRAGLLGLADDYVLFDQYYASSAGGTLGNMLDLTTGSTHGLLFSSKPALTALAGLDVPTLFDRLNDAKVDWRLYDGGLAEIDPAKVADGSYLADGTAVPASLYRAPVLAMRRTWSERDVLSKIVGQEQFFEDARTGDLPAFSLILPSPSDSPAQGGSEGESRLLSLVNAVEKSRQWGSTAIFVTWDDGGGQFDSAVPPVASGLRVPLLVISPYAKHGYISHVEHNHLSLLDLIESRFALRSLRTQPGTSPSFEDAFDVAAGARAPLVGVGAGLPPTPVGTSRQNLQTVVLYAICLVAAAATARAGWLRQRQRAL